VAVLTSPSKIDYLVKDRFSRDAPSAAARHSTRKDFSMNSIWLDLLEAQVRYRGREFRTRTIESGEQNADKLILIHGVGGHAEAYSRNVQRLGQNYHAIAIDLLWHGLSSKPEFTADMVPAYAHQIVDLLDDLGVRKASIEGESLGGWIAMWLALNHPERVDKIVLNTTAGVSWNREAVKIDDAAGANLLRERSVAAIKDPNRETIRKRLEWLMAYPDRVTEELIDLRYAIYTRPDTNASLRDVFANSFRRGPDVRSGISESDLARVSVPALALWSDKNPGAGADVGERLASLVPGAQHYCINDAAHWPQWEKPEEHDRAVLAFLDGRALPNTASSVAATA
jgi:pimeloyl-ACP methyl ester carboxylesterase